MADFSELTAEVARNKSVDDSAIALLTGFQSRLDAAIAEAVAANDGADMTALTALSTELKASSDALAGAVAQNTPSA
jgi:hypothetical protein